MTNARSGFLAKENVVGSGNADVFIINYNMSEESICSLNFLQIAKCSSEWYFKEHSFYIFLSNGVLKKFTRDQNSVYLSISR